MKIDSPFPLSQCLSYSMSDSMYWPCAHLDSLTGGVCICFSGVNRAGYNDTLYINLNSVMIENTAIRVSSLES